MKNCIYKFLNKNSEVIYIGKAKDLNLRLKSHSHLPKECYEQTTSIQYCKFESEYEMDLAERYYIPKLKPEYNTVLSDKDISISIEYFDNKEWTIYRTKNIKKHHIPKKNKDNLSLQKIKEIEESIKQKEKEKLDKIINRKIINPFTREVFNDLNSVSNTYNIPLNMLVEHMTEKRLLGMIHPIYGTHIVFQYYEEFIDCFNKNQKHYDNLFKETTRKVICITTGEIFLNTIKASEHYDLKKYSVRMCCMGNSNYCGVKDEKPLVWKWHDNYIKMSKDEIDSYINKANNIFKKRMKNKK